MKKGAFNLMFVATVALSSVACKNDKENPVEAEEAVAVEEVSEEAVAFDIDTAVSTIRWKGSKPTGEHVGTIDVQNGELMLVGEEITGGTVVIDMNSIEVLDEGMEEDKRTSLENHLKGTVEGKETDFFNVPLYPTATFEITGITEKDGKKILQGNLTIKDQTNSIEIPVMTRVNENSLELESETFSIDRTDWGVNYGSKSVFDNLGDQFIDDEMELTIDVKATRS